MDDKRPVDLLEQDNINRFDRTKKKKKKSGKGNGGNAQAKGDTEQQAKQAGKKSGTEVQPKQPKTQGIQQNSAEGNAHKQDGGKNKKPHNHRNANRPNRSQGQENKE